MKPTGKRKRILKAAARGVLAVVLCVVVYAVVFSVVVKIKDKNSMPMPFGFGATLVMSGSMEPEISVNDLVFVEKPGELHVGDVILYNSGESRVLHRIIDINGDTVTTKGDANNTKDKPISAGTVLGVYTGKVPGAGKIIKFITNPPFFMCVVFLLMAAVITWLFVEERNENKRIERLRAEVEKLKAENEELKKQ